MGERGAMWAERRSEASRSTKDAVNTDSISPEPLRPVLLDEGILSCITDGAKKSRGGPVAKAGLLCERHANLEYNGPSDAHQLWRDETFRLRSRVKIKQNRIIRTRPIFKHWRADVQLQYEDSLLDRDQVIQFASRAGFEVGIGDWRPRYGRFRVESL